MVQRTDVSRVSELADASAGDGRGDSPYSTQEQVIEAIGNCLAIPPVGLVLVELLIELDGVLRVGRADRAPGGEVDRAIVARIEREMAPDDVVLRTGPDQLTIIKPSLSAPAEAEGFALRIQGGLQSSMIVGEARVKLQSAMGVAVSKSGDTPEDLVRYAAHALGDARMLGGDLVVAFDDHDRDLII